VISAGVLITVARVFHLITQIYIVIIIIRAFMTWMPDLHPNRFTYILGRLTDPVFRFVRRRLRFSIINGIDFSPIIILFALYLIDSLVTYLLMRWAFNLPIGG
jgi:YggT family protein